MSDSPLHSVSVAGVTFDKDGRVLLIKRRDNGQWQAPGGILELQESFEDGVKREVLEETGMRVEVERLTGVYKHVHLGVVALVYRCHPHTSHRVSTAEASEVAWFSLDRAISCMEEVFAVRVDDAARTATVASRLHDGVRLLS